MTEVSRELGWDDEIQHDTPDLVTLPEGDYDFEVIDFERARHPGSENLPPCNKAVVKIRIEGQEGVSIIDHNLFLHTKTEGFLANFFNGIGQRKRGEKITMNWNQVVGSRGRARVGVRKWEGKKYNEIKRFHDPFKEEEEKKEFQAGKF